MKTYIVTVDDLKTDEFSSVELSYCQLNQVAYEFARKYGLRSFGTAGVRVVEK